MLAIVYIAGIAAMLSIGQTASSPDRWLWDYRNGVRLEVIGGDLPGSVAAYRRVAVSGAPRLYVQRASYRLAGILARLDRPREARRLLVRLREELPGGSRLHAEVTRRIARLASGFGRGTADWSERLTKAIESSDRGRLDEAAAALARMEGPAGAETLLDLYRQLDPGHAARKVLLSHLAHSEWPGAVPDIRDALGDADAATVAAAARSVGVIGDARSADRLVALLSDAHATVRRAAAWSLGQLWYLPATGRLLALARGDPDAAVRDVAIRVLGCFNAPQAVRGLGKGARGTEPHERPHSFSSWYRRHRRQDAEPQRDFAARRGGASPLIGVAVSAMTHHGPRAYGVKFQPYVAQIRKAWTLQRAGFDVCLLAEREVLTDPDVPPWGPLFAREVQVYPTGQWPRCDVIVLDQLPFLPRTAVRTLEAYVESGGRLLVCGAVGGGWCGDCVAWRNIVGVRRLHGGYFAGEAVRLNWRDAAGASPNTWVAPRCGAFFGRDILAGRVGAQFDSPRVWAVKSHSFGRGHVLCLNWDVGFNVDGANDEDELLAREVDGLLDKQRPWPSVRYMLMKHRRWKDLAAAKGCVDASGLATMRPAERLETIGQLYRIYRLENNGERGRHICRAWFKHFDQQAEGEAELQRIDHLPERLEFALAAGTRYVWWRDLPNWSIPRRGVPLWLAGARELPARVYLRVAVPPGRVGHVRFEPCGASIEGVDDRSGTLARVRDEHTYEVAYDATHTVDGPVNVAFAMADWTAHVRVWQANKDAGE